MATSRTSSGFADQVGRLLSSRYRLVAPIGAGASATVHLADDVNLERRVAVKVLHPGLAADEAFLRRFRAEARAAAALSHPNIMAVYDWGEDGEPYLVLELLSGGSLRSMLDAGHMLSVSQALVVGLDAARALDVAHRRGFVHRDIKPANLLFGDDGRLRIADFGLARALSEAAWTEPGDGLVGTARYAAPEQATAARVDGKADVYALALVLIEAVTGAVPLVADNALATIRLRIDEPVPVPSELGPLVDVLQRSLQPDPADRPDAGEVVQELLAAARELDRPAPLPLVGIDAARPHAFDDDTDLPPRAMVDLTTHAEPMSPAAASRRRRRWWLLAIPLLVAAVIGGALAWQTMRGPSAPVPAVNGQTVADALAVIESVLAENDGLEWEIEEREEYSDGVAVGVVIRSDPAEGRSLGDDGTLTLIVSDGPEPVPVPDLFNYTEGEARSILGDAQLEVGSLNQVFDEAVEAGRVVTWGTSDAGEKPSELPKGTEVDLSISKGPAPRTIPSLEGAPRAEAEAELAELDLTVKVEEEFSSKIDKGLATRTDPAAGTEVPKGSTVTLYISKGPDLVTVPSVKGLSLEQAVRRLENAGLTPGEVFGPANGRADTTDPDAGSKVQRGTTVDIYLRR